MSKPRIGVIVGSASQSSINRLLALGLSRLGQDRADFEFIDLAPLPFYNRDHDAAFPPALQAFKDQVRAVDAVLFVTPEHNRSVPALLKNALDAGSRPYGQSVWAGKPAAVIGTSTSAAGTAMAQQHLRNILAALDMPTLGHPEAFVRWQPELVSAEGEVAAASRDFLNAFLDRFMDWIARNRRDRA